MSDVVKEAIQNNGFYLIYLDADSDAIEQHLLTPQSDGRSRWQHISNYQKAGEQWRQLALTHRHGRALDYAKNADSTIEITKNTSLEDILLETEDIVHSMSTKNIF